MLRLVMNLLSPIARITTPAFTGSRVSGAFVFSESGERNEVYGRSRYVIEAPGTR
jgi:hypothetical protein